MTDMLNQDLRINLFIFIPDQIETIPEQCHPLSILVSQNIAVRDVEKLPGVLLVQHPFQFRIRQYFRIGDLRQIKYHYAGSKADRRGRGWPPGHGRASRRAARSGSPCGGESHAVAQDGIRRRRFRTSGLCGRARAGCQR